MMNLQPHQRVNHYPGSGFISNKVTLAESELKFVPKAFRIPADRKKLMTYAETDPKKMFVLKSNDHRGIEIKPLAQLDLTAEGSFIQEFVDKPLLVDGHKFDIGVYVVLTSVRPLRVYMHAGDVLFRWVNSHVFFNNSITLLNFLSPGALPPGHVLISSFIAGRELKFVIFYLF